MREKFIIVSVILIVVFGALALFGSPLGHALWLIVPAVGVGVYDMTQEEHSLRRNFPLVSRGRWVMEGLRPYLRQYLFESETDGAPISRQFRSVVYQRAKGARDTIPFGTKEDVNSSGYEWLAHSIAAIHPDVDPHEMRVSVGGSDCTQPYSSSLLNISAMSFGSLSGNAILALNAGAAAGRFAHNTGEGAISPYHLEHGGDLIWQIGTGYFGCRTPDGQFDPERFAANAARPSVKMIEIKLSQGAKPGHGGILPASKNTPEIAEIRGVPVRTRVDSPPAHSTFSTPIELMQWIGELRRLSGGKPVGFKLAVGRQSEVVALCLAMRETGIRPDFITVDGGEGGTGASPLEFTNSIGAPLNDALAFVSDTLTGFDLKDEIRIIAGGKLFTAFHMARCYALGADICDMARGFMLALGCVQSLICNTNHCPTGIATQDQGLEKGLVPTDKAVRVQRFHDETLTRLAEILGAAGIERPDQMNRTHIYRRINHAQVRRYDELFPYAERGALLSEPYPPSFTQSMAEAAADSFLPHHYVAEHRGGLTHLDDAVPG